MKYIKVYKYAGEDGELVSPVDLPMERIEMYRLCAEAGKLLTNGSRMAAVADIETSDLPLWSETDAPQETDDQGDI